jgi:hypothetical protein
MTSIPVWLVALVLAALAPWGARALETALARRLRRRTQAFLAQALPQRADTAAGQQRQGESQEKPPP